MSTPKLKLFTSQKYFSFTLEIAPNLNLAYLSPRPPALVCPDGLQVDVCWRAPAQTRTGLGSCCTAAGSK